MRYFFIIVFIVFSITIQATEIKPFTSDGCSVFPNGTFEQQGLWLNCCTAHDYVYWQGGTYKARLIADKQLYQCIVELDQPKIATLMFMGVRVAGSPYVPAPYRWGYGWPYFRGYNELTEEENKKINSINN